MNSRMRAQVFRAAALVVADLKVLKEHSFTAVSMTAELWVPILVGFAANQPLPTSPPSAEFLPRSPLTAAEALGRRYLRLPCWPGS